MRRAVMGAVIVGALAIVAMIAAGAGSVWAQDDDEYNGPMSRMTFVVVKDTNGKPVRNAAVVLHPVKKNGKQAMGGLELKTDDDGKTAIEGIPYGPLRVQVLAQGFQTFGEDYRVDQAETLVTIRLKRPAKQITSYGVQDGAKKNGDAGKTDGTAQQSPPQQ
jgi:5-hydroxyisourate hydrolase-like protein (transthyretin family)